MKYPQKEGPILGPIPCTEIELKASFISFFNNI